MGFEHLQSRRLHSFLAQPVLGLHHLHSKEVFPHIQMELPVFQSVNVAPCPVSGHCWEESVPILLMPALKVFVWIDWFPSQLSLLS